MLILKFSGDMCITCVMWGFRPPPGCPLLLVLIWLFRLHRSGAARCRPPPNNDDLWRTWYMGLQQMTMSVSIIATPTQHTPNRSMDVEGWRQSYRLGSCFPKLIQIFYRTLTQELVTWQKGNENTSDYILYFAVKFAQYERKEWFRFSLDKSLFIYTSDSS